MNKKDIAMQLACMIGHNENLNYKEGLMRSVEIYKELTGEDEFDKLLEIQKQIQKPKRKWYQFLKLKKKQTKQLKKNIPNS